MAPRRTAGADNTNNGAYGVHAQHGQGTQAPDGKALRTVTVACKLPNGLILRLFHKVSVRHAGPGGFVSVEEFQVDPEAPVFRVNGNAFPRNGGGVLKHDVTGDNGYGLTHGIPRDFWEKWVLQFKDTPAVVNGLIFAFPNREDAIARANELEDLRTGLEPLDPNKLPRTGIVTRGGGKVSSVGSYEKE